ncbi:MAG: hypothetical protein CMH98_18340 [Oceanospirillaceae bacterium]|nr:hypothetical protein [Oceanospirillaceae bacterium]|tara:strand:+ start:477 stop:920 length:444 start_codon:yes stop_codon:yes gene_type:complete
MKIIIVTILLTYSGFSFSFEPEVVQGSWAVYHENLTSGDYYYFLQINKDWSGELTRSLGHAPITRSFQKKNVIFRDGYIEIQASESEKMVLSAWVLPSGSGRLTGQLFMYKENGDLFNMLYYPLSLVNQDSELLEYDEISKLYNKHH